MTARDKELNFIWENTRIYKTEDSEIAALCDLYDGLEKSGYEIEKFQKWDNLINTYFVVFDRYQLEDILGTLEKHNNLNYDEKWFDTTLDDVEYKNKSLRIHPSSRLTVNDLQANPMLLALLIGELSNYGYYINSIKFDEEFKEIYVSRYYSKESPTHANACAHIISEALVKLSDLNTRSQYTDTNCIYFESERNLGGKLGFSYEPPVLKIGGKPLYETGNIPYALLRLRDMEKRLTEIEGNPKAEKGIKKGINQRRKNLENQEGAYFPCFRVL